MRRRLDLAGSLVAAPPVLFLDEPTTGLDPHGRRQLWEVIRAMVGGGTTVLLTTQYLEEADQLADRILIDHGRAIAEGTADELKSRIGAERIEVTVTDAAALERARQVLARFAVGEQQADTRSRARTFALWSPVSAVTQATRELFGNIPPGTAPPEAWPLQHPVLYTLLWAVLLVAVFAPLSVHRYRTSGRRS